MIKLTYTVKFHKNLQINKESCIQKIISVLNDPRGWKNKGFYFNYKLSIDNPDFIIFFTSSKWIANFCNLPGLSCTDLRYNEIYINVDNWRNGSIHSQLNLNNYKTYLINHEVGHILGKKHIKCPSPNSKVPVMTQQTLGIGECIPNPWPLDWE